jgi:hypothetical protein
MLSVLVGCFQSKLRLQCVPVRAVIAPSCCVSATPEAMASPGVEASLAGLAALRKQQLVTMVFASSGTCRHNLGAPCADRCNR